MIKKIFIIISICLYSYGQSLDLSGTVISDNEKVISSRNMGYIKGVYVSEGSFVKKGDLLYEIDSSNIDSNKKEILLNLQIQENQLKNIKTNYNRYKRLYAQDLVPKYDLEQLELNLNNTKNMIAITKAKLKEINVQYDYLKIKAPNDGIILKKTIKVGEMSLPSAPALILSDLSNLKIKTNIAESNLNSVRLNQKIDIKIPSISFETVGKISAIIPSINASTHSFVLKISFDTQGKTIYPGMYAELSLNLKQK